MIEPQHLRQRDPQHRSPRPPRGPIAQRLNIDLDRKPPSPISSQRPRRRQRTLRSLASCSLGPERSTTCSSKPPTPRSPTRPQVRSKHRTLPAQSQIQEIHPPRIAPLRPVPPHKATWSTPGVAAISNDISPKSSRTSKKPEGNGLVLRRGSANSFIFYSTRWPPLPSTFDDAE